MVGRRPNRGRLEILLTILTVLYLRGGEMSVTRIMYAANLNWNSLTGSLDYLDRCGAIAVHRDRVTLRTRVTLTEKGKSCLGHIMELNKILRVVGAILKESNIIFVRPSERLALPIFEEGEG